MKPINLFKPEQNDFKQMLSIGGKQVYLNSQKILALVTNVDTHQFDDKRLSTDRMFSRGDIAYYDNDYYMVITQVAHRYESFNGQMRRLENHIYFNMSFLSDAPNKYIMKIPVIPQKTGEFNLKTNNEWGIVDVVQRISLFVPQNEWTARIIELENQPNGVIIFGRRPYKIIGVTNNDKGMYAINLELTTLEKSQYDKENGIYMPPLNWKNYENLSIYDLSVDQEQTIPQVQTNVGIIRTVIDDAGWSTELKVTWDKDKSSPLYLEYLTGYKVGVYYGSVLGAEKTISSPDTTEVTFDTFKNYEDAYTVKIEAIYGKDGTVTYMLPQVETFETNVEPLPIQQTNVGNIILSKDNDSLDVRWEKDKTLPDKEKYLSNYLVNIYSNDEQDPKLITQVDNGLNLYLKWLNNTLNKPKYYAVGIQSVFIVNGKKTIMKQQFASTKPEQGTVTINYVDDKGVSVKPVVTLTGDVGSQYQIEQLVIPDYNFLTVDGVTSGVFTKEPITVTYKYKKVEVVKGTVTVSYTGTDGTKLKDDVIIQQVVGTSYSTIKDNFGGYTFKQVTGNENGLITVEPQTVKYIYDKVSIPVDDNKITHKAWSWSADGKDRFTTTYPNLNLLDGTSSTPKTVSATYWFAGPLSTLTDTSVLKKGKSYTYSVWIENCDVDTQASLQVTGKTTGFKEQLGNVIKAGTSGLSTVTFKVDDDITKCQAFIDFMANQPKYHNITYSKLKLEEGSVVTPHMPSKGEIKPEDYPSYIGIYKDDKTSASTKPEDYTWTLIKDVGSSPEPVVPVVQVPTKGKVTVYYKDTDGKDISAPVIMTGNVGDRYTSTSKRISDYTFKSNSGNIEGVYTVEPIEVTFKYEKDSDDGGW